MQWSCSLFSTWLRKIKVSMIVSHCFTCHFLLYIRYQIGIEITIKSVPENSFIAFSFVRIQNRGTTNTRYFRYLTKIYVLWFRFQRLWVVLTEAEYAVVHISATSRVYYLRRPSPRQEMHVLVDAVVPVLTGFLFCVSLAGSSHLFSPRRNTLCSETPTPKTPFSVTTVFWTSAIPVTAGTAAPFVPS